MNEINIFIVEDHKIVRQGLSSLLFGINDIKLINEASKGKEFLSKMEYLKPDVIIMDVGLPDISGIELTEIVTQKYPEIKVVILTANVDEQIITKSIKAGACGFLSKDTSKEEFLNAIRTVYAGEEFFGEGISRILYNSYVKTLKQPQKDKNKLTNREIEVMQQIASGLNNKQIAEKLFISVRTVETHKNNILEKLKLNNSVEIAIYAIKNDIVTI